MSRRATGRALWRISRVEVLRSLTVVLLSLYVVSVPLKFHVGWFPLYVQLALLSVLVIRVLSGLQRVTFTRTQLVALAILGLTVCLTLTGQLLGVSGRNVDKLPETTRFVILALACVLELDSPRRMRQLLGVVMVTAAVIGLLSVVNLAVQFPFARTTQVRSLGPISLPRSLGVVMSFGDYGLLAVTGGSYAAMSVSRPAVIHGSDRGYERALSAISLVLILLGVVVGQSRSTLLAFAAVGASGLVIAAMHPDDAIRAKHSWVPGTLLAAGAVGVTVNAASLTRSLIDANAGSVAVRLEQYRFALKLIAQRPILGWGWTFFKTSFPPGINVHNMWLLLGVSLGVPVMLLWIYMFSRFGVGSLRQALDCSSWACPYGIIGVAMVVGGSIELLLYTGFTPGTAVLIGLLTAMQGLGRRESAAA